MASKTTLHKIIHVGDTLESLHPTAGCMAPFTPCFTNGVQCNAPPIPVYICMVTGFFQIVSIIY